MTTGIYRTTEDGNPRVLEDSVSVRVTENYLAGEAGLTASSGVTFTGTLNQKIASSLTASASISAVPTFIGTGASLIANNSIMVADARVITLADASFVASASVVLDGRVTRPGVSALNASGSLNASGKITQYANVVSGTLEFNRITEASDVRITEGGDTRITDPVTTNNIEGTLVAEAHVTPFTSIGYIKVSGEWKEIAQIDVKQQANWGYFEKLYRHTSGSWKRIY